MTSGDHEAGALPFLQSAYRVDDIREAALHWVAAFGAGPFYCFEHIPLRNVRYLNQPTTLDHSSAYGWLGEEMIELVQQNCTRPSVFTGHPRGLHHRARFVRSLDAECQRLHALGDPTAMTATTSTGLRFAFVDSRSRLGHYQELYEEHPGLRTFYRQIRQAAEGWTGEQPLRRFDQG